MAESEAKSPPDSAVQIEEKQLKYLDFVQVAAIYFFVFFTTLYDYAKENSGPLKPGVQAVEGTVKTVIGPVYDKFRHVPIDFLKFVDRKVDESINEVDSHVPSLIKQVSSISISAARAVASELHRAGVVNGASNIAKSVYAEYEPTAKEMYSKYEPVAESYAMMAWRGLNRLPLFPQVAHIMVPTAKYWSEKYNQTVVYGAEKGYGVAYYLPLVPIEKIGKVFEGVGTTNGEPVVA